MKEKPQAILLAFWWAKSNWQCHYFKLCHPGIFYPKYCSKL